jgi:predicted nucleic acid-binding protein
VSRAIILDTGVIGLLTHTKAPEHQQCHQWQQSMRAPCARICIPEIADYEIRRELLRLDFRGAIAKLDELRLILDYIPLTPETMLKAAEFWAQIRRQGMATADDKALDGDVILAAQASILGSQGFDIVIATTNVGHLSRFVPADLWQNIT